MWSPRLRQGGDTRPLRWLFALALLPALIGIGCANYDVIHVKDPRAVALQRPGDTTDLLPAPPDGREVEIVLYGPELLSRYARFHAKRSRRGGISLPPDLLEQEGVTDEGAIYQHGNDGLPTIGADGRLRLRR